MARKQISYFAEERGRNNNPNFFIQKKDEELRKQVKRIIRDIKNDCIEDQDLTYFKNDRIISACLYESYRQWKESETLINSLMHYMNTVLSMNSPRNQFINVWEERTNASNLIQSLNKKVVIWRVAYFVFSDISNNCDIRGSLINIVNLDKSLFYDL